MTTAIIGVGQIGSGLARDLVRGGERVVLAARDQSHADALASELGDRATAAPVREAIADADADVVVLAIWLDQCRALMPQIADLLEGKVVVDPSNPIGFDDKGQVHRTLPEGTSAGSVVAGLLPNGAQFVKAFGSLGAASLANDANRSPRRAVLFYATDDGAADTTERLITAAGFDPVKVGGIKDAGRIEVPGGDLHQNGGLNGRLLDVDQARAAVASA